MKQLVKSPVNFTSGHCREEEESPRKKKKKIQRGNKFKTQNGQGGGGDKYDGDTADYREGSLGLTFFQNDVRTFFETAERSRLWDMTPTKNHSPTSQQYGRELSGRSLPMFGKETHRGVPQCHSRRSDGHAGQSRESSRRTGRGDCFNVLL